MEGVKFLHLEKNIYPHTASVVRMPHLDYGVSESAELQIPEAKNLVNTLMTNRMTRVNNAVLPMTADFFYRFAYRIKEWYWSREGPPWLGDDFDGFITPQGTRAFRLKENISATDALERLINGRVNLNPIIANAILLSYALRMYLGKEAFDEAMSRMFLTEDWIANSVLSHVFSCGAFPGFPCDRKRDEACIKHAQGSMLQWCGMAAFLGNVPNTIDRQPYTKHILYTVDHRIGVFLRGKDCSVMEHPDKLCFHMIIYEEFVELMKHRTKIEFETKKIMPSPPFSVTFKTTVKGRSFNLYDPLECIGILSSEKPYTLETKSEPVKHFEEVVEEVTQKAKERTSTPPPLSPETTESIKNYFDKLGRRHFRPPSPSEEVSPEDKSEASSGAEG